MNDIIESMTPSEIACYAFLAGFLVSTIVNLIQNIILDIRYIIYDKKQETKKNDRN